MPKAPPDKKRRILDAAVKLLVERGFQDIVLDDVAKAAGVAKGTLFLYYKGKDELFASVYKDLVDQLGTALDAIAASDRRGKERLQETIAVILNHLDRHSDFLSRCQTHAFQSHGRHFQKMLFEKFKANTDRIRSILRSCARDGVIADQDSPYAPFALVGLCRSAMFAKLISGSKKPLARDTNTVLKFFIRGAGGTT